MLWAGRLNIAKMKILPKLIYSFNIIPVKISAKIFVDTENFILKFIEMGRNILPNDIIETVFGIG